MQRWLKENRGFLIFLLGFGVFRLAIADWNPVPSASMRPTLLEGDVVLVNRLAYDLKLPFTDISLLQLGEPQRGDVITFTSPKDGVRLIKRLAALPGDRVEMRDEQLFINGVAAQYDDPVTTSELIGSASTAAVMISESLSGNTRTVQFLPAVRAQRSFGPLVVPPDAYFFLGDNRDNSADSRYIGFVSRSLLIGHAHRILVSANIIGNWLPRIERIGKPIR